MVAILAAIFNMVAKTHKKFRSAPMLPITKKIDIYGFFPQEECDSDKSDLKMANYLRLIL